MRLFPNYFKEDVLSLHMEYGKDTKFTIFCLFSHFFLFSHGFLHRDFTDQREIWQKALPISQAGVLKFWGQYAQ